MRALTIVVADGDPVRFRTALALATAAAALDAPVTLFLQGPAVARLRTPLTAPDDDIHVDAGLPSLAAHHAEATGLGVRFVLCQSGLQLTGTVPDDYPPGTDYAGLVSVLADLGDGRLVTL